MNSFDYSDTAKDGGSSILEGEGYPSMANPQPSAPLQPPPVLGPTLSYPSMAGAKRFEDVDRPQQQDARGRLVETDGTTAKMIPKLSENPSPEDLQEYRGAMGIPETPDRYDIDRSSWPADMGPYPEKVEKGFLEFAHKNHMTPQQVQAAYDWYMDGNLNPDGGVSESESMKALQGEWGNEAQANIEIARSAFESLTDEKITEKVERSGLGNDPDMIRMFHSIGLRLKGRTPPPVNLLKRDVSGRTRIFYPSMER